MTYEERCKSLGIDRAAITVKCMDPKNPAVGREKELLTERVGPRVKVPMEDISHLIHPYGQTISQRLRKK